MGIKFTNNIDEVLNKVNEESNRLSGDVSFTVLFNEYFMSKYTNFQSFEELLTAGNYEVNSKKDFEDIPEDDFDKHIAQCTRFESWEEMYSKAGKNYIASNFNL